MASTTNNPAPEKAASVSSNSRDSKDLKTTQSHGAEVEKGTATGLGHESDTELKLRVLNDAMQSVGFGKYHLLPGLLIPTTLPEFFTVDPSYLVITVYAGLFVGAAFWGLMSDLYGRVWPFNLTLIVAGVFATAAGGANTFTQLAVLIGLFGFGAGEFMPASHSYLLTALQTFWILGNMFIAGLAWAFIPKRACDFINPCTKEGNMGWRYMMFTFGSVTLLLGLVRFFAFPIHESPRYLLARGRDEEAVAVVQAIAKYNGVECSLTVEDLKKVGSGRPEEPATVGQKFGYVFQRIVALFKPLRMALSTVILIVLWSAIGLATTLYYSFLPYLLSLRAEEFGAGTPLDITYRNQFIISTCGLIAPYLASLAVEIPFLGRRGTLAIGCALSGTFLLASTTSKNSNALLGWNCGYQFGSAVLYSVLYAFTTEVFPTKNRGTGNAIVSMFIRISGVLAPLLVLYYPIESTVPAYVGGGLTVACCILPLLVPYEPRGKPTI
ncbi:hypothetical protein CC1G_02148 [Coprinopsis cinerea okayama7|uniref:Major facilitator superfamily (MFS) profile domain-containing protein n=1 Tax=Coprinopsis cinerea (strain Okayama-7 / 130 / ATCC MYA-4618 / FGSC 9003) TaxID=240176 RepID=A8NKC8_COPC7|nr:hypothetical protein CC1G_02148 [Coprinopsis cinerea okayama7\|eukprot:XP_001834412.2 hypothetical protein CC1G_02148 [Coprinopsis cinerea okayama7\